MANETNQKVKLERNLVREGGLAQRVKELKALGSATLVSAGIYSLGLNGEELLPSALLLGLTAYAFHREQNFYREPTGQR